MVNIENMQTWIDALRSGEYRQTKGRLEWRRGWNCAEGVACREAMKAGVHVPTVRVGGETAFDGLTGEAPEAVVRWLGLRDFARPRITTIDGGWRFVYTANDSDGMSFDDIADGLYRQYLKEPKTDG